MTKTDPERFMERYRRVWSDISPSAYAELYSENGSILLQDGSRVPRSNIEAFMEQVLQAVPDLSLVVKNWAARGDAVLFEWEMHGTTQAGALALRGCDRFTLHGSLAVESVAYYDPSPLTSQTSPRAVAEVLRPPGNGSG